MSTFAENYGIEVTGDQNEATASLLVTEPYLNGFNCAFGGSLILMGNAAGQQAIGPGKLGANYSFRYLRKALAGETMVAKAHIIKEGANSNSVIASIKVDDRLIGSMYADYFRIGRHLPFNDAHNLVDAHQPPCDMVLNAPDNIAGAGQGGDLVQLFTDTITHHYLDKYTFGPRVCVGLHTDDRFCDVNGDIDPALIGMLYDETLGIACIEAAGTVVTTNLNISMMERVRPGSFIACAGRLLIQSGRLLETHGYLFADERLVGTCTGTFISINAPNTTL